VALTGSTSTEQAIRLETGEHLAIDFRLEVESAERIDVIAAAPMVDPDQAGATSTLPAEVAAELAFPTRSYQSLVALLPGVVHMAQTNTEGTPAVN
jgi:hypothetical protein